MSVDGGSTRSSTRSPRRRAEASATSSPAARARRPRRRGRRLGRAVLAACSRGSTRDTGDACVDEQVDPSPGRPRSRSAQSAVWVADSDAEHRHARRPDGTARRRSRSATARRRSRVGAGGVWVADTLDDAVVRIDPSTNAVTTTIPVGRAPTGDRRRRRRRLGREQRRRHRHAHRPARPTTVTKTIEVGGSPQGIVVADGRVWVTRRSGRRSAAARRARQGGTARVDVHGDVDSMDPALAYTDWLVAASRTRPARSSSTIPDKPAPAGSQLVPEVAASLPTRSADGKTYTFTIRKGFRFSPPSNEPVTAQTFKYAIERTLDPSMNGPAPSLPARRRRRQALRGRQGGHIAGVARRGNTLTIRLTAPCPDFLARLAMPFFCAVPLGTPLDPKGVRSDPLRRPVLRRLVHARQGVVLERNPNYTGRGRTSSTEIELAAECRRGAGRRRDRGRHRRLRRSTASIPATTATLAARYGPGSPAARAGKQQYFVNRPSAIDFFALNTHRPLFATCGSAGRSTTRSTGGTGRGSSSVRRLVRLRPTSTCRPACRASRTCTSTRSTTRSRPRTAARRQATPDGVLYTCNIRRLRRAGADPRRNLAAIGIHVEVKAFPPTRSYKQWRRRASRRHRLEPAGSPTVLRPLRLPQRPVRRQPREQPSISRRFDDPAYNRRLEAAAKLTGRRALPRLRPARRRPRPERRPARSVGQRDQPRLLLRTNGLPDSIGPTASTSPRSASGVTLAADRFTCHAIGGRNRTARVERRPTT